METERQIFKRYATVLTAIASLDRAYYLNPQPSLADRRAYFDREAHLERLRLCLRADLARIRRFNRHRCFGCH
jgi:hypothetical protein